MVMRMVPWFNFVGNGSKDLVAAWTSSAASNIYVNLFEENHEEDDANKVFDEMLE